jgi:predicted ArsR family transcriptional regulator
MNDAEFERQIAGLAALDEPLRRRLYLYVASRHDEVSREEAARAVGTSRTLAGFHLDRLAEQGLLETSFRRLTGRTGPGAGRPAKLYRRSSRELAVSLPPRSYELAARILARAVDASGAPETHAALKEIARSTGERIGEDARERAAANATREERLQETMNVLAAHGYEPSLEGSEIRLRNCPFHALAAEHRSLVCGLNLSLIEGVVSALDLVGTEAALDPRPGMCCVALALDRSASEPER